MEYKLITNNFEKDLFRNAWEEAFSRKWDSEVFSWLFTDRNNMYAIFDGDRMAAGYCLLNQKMVYNGNIIDGALCNNVFVTQDYRGLKLFTKLGHYSIEKAGEQGIKMIIGIPNESAVSGHKRVGWTFLNQIPFLEKRNVEFSEILSSDKIKVLNNENYEKYKEQLEKFSIEISNQRTFSVLKEKDYFKWRYLDRPLVDYKTFIYMENDTVLGYIVYKFYDALNRLHIIDVEAANKEIFNSLINLTESFQKSFSLVNVWGSSIYNDYFLKAGFEVSTEVNNLIAIEPLKSEPVEFGDKTNIVLGDNEVF
ncbi:MAG: GNAT family N-acetyltransferase [Halanaerobiales bacterium]|nr:GNAT family N-acetyltransferase [Halanaerobiales bacterium]